VLVQIALIAFALSGLVALAIDIGYARLTQGQLQNAADSAALEGLRNRDAVRNPANGNPIAYASDCVRRAAANRMVHRTFDDDFDYASGDPDYQFGGGPVISVTDGVTSAHALQTVSVPDQHVYKPDLQMNQQNQVYGDMVSGRFCYTTDPVPSEGGAYEVQDVVCTESQHATGTYS
jgi:Putative Flp pilus-assembly TadE/G-like